MSLLTTELTEPETSFPGKRVTVQHINEAAASDQGVNRIGEVAGLFYIREFLTPQEQADCISQVDAAGEQWLNDLSRRVQHYGWRYDYKARAITPDMYLGVLPGWLETLAEKIHRVAVLPDGTALFARPPEQVIVNEYKSNQGIAMHIDHRGFGPAICTISLLEDWEMDFRLRQNNKQPAMLERGSCVVLTEEARYKWQHGIAPRKRERDGIRRGRRVSLTFRTVDNRDDQND